MKMFMVLLVVLAICVFCYKPIIFIHGGGGTEHDFDGPKKWIGEAHPGTKIYSLSYYNLLKGYESLLYQIPFVENLVRETRTKFGIEDGYHLVTHSQAGVIGRALLHQMDDHGVGDWISLAGPIIGVYGLPQFRNFPKHFEHLLNLTLEEVTNILYEPKMQYTLSFSNYWISPYEFKEYLTSNKLLPILNNETNNENSTQYKTNFVKVDKMVFFGSPQDGTVRPWQSLHWGTYQHGDMEKITKMEDQEWYQKDYFGLKTLNEQGKIILETVENVKHIDWVFSKNVFVENVIPYLD